MKPLNVSILILVSSLSMAAFAENTTRDILPDMRRADTSEFKPSLGISAGLATSEDGRRQGAAYGIEYGFQPYIPFSTSLELSGNVAASSGPAAGLTRTKLLVKAAYNFGGNIVVLKDSHIGLGIGPVWDNERNYLSTEFGIAPELGFDIPIGGPESRYTLGANANYLFVGGARPDVFAINGVAKYWF